MNKLRKLSRRYRKRYITPNYWIAEWRYDDGTRGYFAVYAETYYDALKQAKIDLWSHAEGLGAITVDVRRPNWLERIAG